MKQLKVLRLASVAVLSLSLGAGVVSASPGTASIVETGPDSTNTVTFNGQDRRVVRNSTSLRVKNTNPQTAHTGDATVKHNNRGGSATTGMAANDSMATTRASVNNSSSSSAALNSGGGGSSMGTIETTGPDSVNRITFNNGSNVRVTNENCITVENSNTQRATSGNARVEDNTTGGDATSGDAMNVSTTEVVLTLTN